MDVSGDWITPMVLLAMKQTAMNGSGVQPNHRGVTITMVINHILIGMILQVRPPTP